MQILGVLLIIVGIVLMIVGKNLSRHLPPECQREENGFYETLKSFGNMICGLGVIGLVGGVICLFMTVVG